MSLPLFITPVRMKSVLALTMRAPVDVEILGEYKGGGVCCGTDRPGRTCTPWPRSGRGRKQRSIAPWPAGARTRCAATSPFCGRRTLPGGWRHPPFRDGSLPGGLRGRLPVLLAPFLLAFLLGTVLLGLLLAFLPSVRRTGLLLGLFFLGHFFLDYWARQLDIDDHAEVIRRVGLPFNQKRQKQHPPTRCRSALAHVR